MMMGNLGFDVQKNDGTRIIIRSIRILTDILKETKRT